jgi:hypothetical protein
MPITFYIELNPQKPMGQLSNVLHKFEIFYNVLEANKALVSDLENASKTSGTSGTSQSPRKPKQGKGAKVANRIHPTTYDKRNVLQFTHYTMPLCHFGGHNLWLLKPTCLNRGQGIHVFHDLETLRELIVSNCARMAEDPMHDGPVTKGEGGKEEPRRKENVMVNSFIIQKYIERPMLIESRKFDVRVWVLLSHELDCFFFKEGYLRTSSSAYEIDPNNVDNKFVHLTNNAVQKFAQNYGNFEDGNQMSFPAFQLYLNLHHPHIRMCEDLVPQMKALIKKSMLAVRKKVNMEGRRHSMEIFGYDFIIDADFNVWLIEVNTNPCLEESSDLLKSLIPRMIDDALKLTVDKLYPIPTQHSAPSVPRYPVTGYADDLNMW